MTSKTVLYVEDSATDVFFMRHAFRMLGHLVCLQVVGNGEDAMGYLAGTNAFADRQQYPLPSLVLLDLKLPGKQGLEVLEWIRLQPQFQTLPVVVFSSSDLQCDRNQAQRLGVTEYIVKPGDMTIVSGLVAPLLKRFLDIEAPVEPVPSAIKF
ncbi:MAG: response regulator [Verrucomicrobia bacterium]|nr:response regulator [Verrucomicrobiota bacterium]